MDRKELVHRVSKYILSIGDPESLDKEWIHSTIPYPISISLRTIRDVLDENKPVDPNCFNMAVRTVACNVGRFCIEEKYHFMDLQFCDMSQIGRDIRCRDKINYKELSKLLEWWPDMDYDIKDCSTVLLPLHRDRLYTLFVIEMKKKNVYILDPLAPNLERIGNDRCSPYLTTLRDIADHFNLAMKFVNPTWNHSIFDWDRDLPRWLPRYHGWRLSGFLAYYYLKKWEGKKLLMKEKVDTLRMEFLVDILMSHQNECQNYPGELKDLLRQFTTYL